ncbi:MAG TPA: DUF5615 family PIN-like protein [Longimicrobium sp.]|nr:DUF5615 family PIN-like protein [Longimicrobium sp.]
MKLLFDENLSFRLVRALMDIYPESAHVRDVGLLGADDPAIWAYAVEHGFLLTSKDTDFYDRSVFFGAPPKVLWLRIGTVPLQKPPTFSGASTSWFAASTTIRQPRSFP